MRNLHRLLDRVVGVEIFVVQLIGLAAVAYGLWYAVRLLQTVSFNVPIK